MDLIRRQYSTITGVSGPLVFVEGIKRASFSEMCRITLPNGETRLGQILKLFEEHAVVQVLEGTSGIGIEKCVVSPLGEVARLGVSEDLLGRVFTGMGEPSDGLPPIIPEARLDINGYPMNPVSRDGPDEFIETGISAIDGLNTLVRGQKLPIFSSAGLPANDLVMQIVSLSRVPGAPGASGAPGTDGKAPGGNAGAKNDDFYIVLGAMGVTSREAYNFTEGLRQGGARERTVAFINLASEPAIERLFTPRLALTTAEYLAFEKGRHVLVILTDMTAYCDSLREIAGAREEIPGRRGYPGYMYTDLATLYERAGRIKGKSGSVTVVPVITMPDDDITHPIPDLTGYITEGQIVLERSFHRRHLFPPINVLPSLSRLMNRGIGEGKTLPGHRELADQLYASYARGCDVRRLVAIVGEEGLTTLDKSYLKFADSFENDFISQGEKRRTIAETLTLARELLTLLPAEELTRLGGPGKGKK